MFFKALHHDPSILGGPAQHVQSFVSLPKPLHHDKAILCEEGGGVFWLHKFTCACPAFPTPPTEATVLTPLYIFISFVED